MINSRLNSVFLRVLIRARTRGLHWAGRTFVVQHAIPGATKQPSYAACANSLARVELGGKSGSKSHQAGQKEEMNNRRAWARLCKISPKPRSRWPHKTPGVLGQGGSHR